MRWLKSLPASSRSGVGSGRGGCAPTSSTPDPAGPIRPATGPVLQGLVRLAGCLPCGSLDHQPFEGLVDGFAPGEGAGKFRKGLSEVRPTIGPGDPSPLWGDERAGICWLSTRMPTPIRTDRHNPRRTAKAEIDPIPGEGRPPGRQGRSSSCRR